mgnify:CR=1 FL=1
MAMDKPALYSRRPILTAPLRWRAEFATLCLFLAIIDRWAPSHLMNALTVPMVIVVLIVAIYPMMDGADPRLLEPNRPRLVKGIGIAFLVGLTATFANRVMTDDFSSRDGFYLFLLGALMSGPPVLSGRQKSKAKASDPSG